MEKLARLIYLAIILAILYFVFPFFLPFIFALILVVLFEPIVLWIQYKTRVKRNVSVVTVFTTFFAIVFGFCYFAISKLIKEGIELVKAIPNKFDTLLNDNKFFYDFYNSFSEENKLYVKDTMMKLVEKATGFASSYAGNLFEVVKSFPVYFIAFIVFIVAVYIMSIELPTLRSAFLKYFEKGQSQKKIEIVLDKLKTAVIGFIRVQFIFSALTFIITAIGLKILAVEYVVVASLIVVIVDILPILGTGSVLVPWAVYLIVTGHMYQGVGLLVLFIVITVFRRIIEPKLLGDTLGLKPLITLVSLYVGFELMGVFGMILGPMLVIIIQALEEAELLKLRIKV